MELSWSIVIAGVAIALGVFFCRPGGLPQRYADSPLWSIPR